MTSLNHQHVWSKEATLPYCLECGELRSICKESVAPPAITSSERVDALTTALRCVREKREYILTPETKSDFLRHEVVLERAITAARDSASTGEVSRAVVENE